MSRPWWKTYQDGRRSLEHVTSDEVGRLAVRHARTCSRGCAYIVYDETTSDLVLELSCTVGAVVHDEIERRQVQGWRLP